MEVAKSVLGPEVESALGRMAVRQLDYVDALRQQEEDQRRHPKPDGDGSVGRDHWDEIEIRDGDDGEEGQFPRTEATIAVPARQRAKTAITRLKSIVERYTLKV
ncbi:MAG: hypothetical protein ABSG65_22415 [Bryobacteraceae bacterium]